MPDLWLLFVQYVLPSLSAGLMGALGVWLANRALKPKTDSEAHKLEAEAEQTRSTTALKEFDSVISQMRSILSIRDEEIKQRGIIIVDQNKTIAEKNIIIAHALDALGYLREQARPFTPMAVTISYDIESGKTARPFNGGGHHGDDITEAH